MSYPVPPAPEADPVSPETPLTASVKSLDLEVKDAHLIFNSVWQSLEAEVGLDRIRFPKEVIWLNGAPGAGKGTQTEFIMQFRGLTAPPILVSSLLQSPEARELIDSGMMVGDREVTGLVIRALLRPENASGVVVDGYPRTKVQVICLKLLHEKLLQMRSVHRGTDREGQFPKPMFHIVVLFIDEAESVRRQILRGERALQHNREVEASGVGRQSEVRATDLSRKTARNRYRTFKEVTYESLTSLREVFFYHYINAHGSIGEVQRRIEDELRYQSSLELDQRTHDVIGRIPIAQSLSVHARQDLVRRLDLYCQEDPDLFAQAVALIEEKFLPIIVTHSISGKAYINSEHPILEDHRVLAMIIDIFSERGFHTVVDVRKYAEPARVNRVTFVIETRAKKVWRFIISFPGSEIRRGS
jgi:adenylate kinase